MKLFSNIRITKNVSSYVILLFFVALFSRYPILLVRTIGPDNPGDDIALYYDIAQNIKDGEGVSSDIIDYFCKYDGFEHNNDFNFKNISRPRYRSAPVFPIYLTAIFKINNSLDAAYYSMSFLFAVLIVLFFFFVNLLFDLKIAFLSSVILIFNPYFIGLSTLVATENLYFILLILVFYLLLKKINNKSNYQYIAIIGLITSIACLTRYAGVTIIGSVVIWLLITKKWKSAIIYFLFSIIPFILWVFIRNYLNYRDLFLAFEILGSNYPPAIEESGSSFSIQTILVIINNVIGYWGNVLSEFSSSRFLYLIFPFSIIGSIIYIKDKRILLLIIYTLVTIFFHSTGLFGSRIIRYSSPTLLVLIPVGVATLIYFLNKFPGIKISGVNINKTKVLALFMLITVFGYLSTMYFEYGKIIPKVYSKRELNTASVNYEWIVENAEPDDIIASTSPRAAHYYTDLKCVTLPNNVNQKWFDHYLSYYGIDYILIENNKESRFKESEFIISNLFRGEKVIQTDHFEIELIQTKVGYGEIGYKGRVDLYRVNKFNN